MAFLKSRAVVTSNVGGSKPGADDSMVVVTEPDASDAPDPDDPDEDDPDDDPLPPEDGKPPELRGSVKTGGRVGTVPPGRVGCGVVVDATGAVDTTGVVGGSEVVGGAATTAARIETVSTTSGAPATG